MEVSKGRPVVENASVRRLAAGSDAAVAAELRRSFHRNDGGPADSFTLVQKWIAGKVREGAEVSHLTYAEGIRALGMRRRPKLAEKLHYSMTEHSIAPTAETYSSLLSALAHGGRLDRIPFVWHAMREANISPTPSCYHSLLRGYAILGDHSAATEAINEMKTHGFEISQKALLALVESCPSLEEGQNVVAQNAPLLEPYEETALALLRLCRRVGDASGAKEVYAKYVRRTEPSQITADCAKVLLEAKRSTEALQLLQTLEYHTRGSYEILLHCHLRRNSSYDLYYVALEAALEEYPQYAPFYELQIRFHIKEGEMETAIELANSLQLKGVRPHKRLIQLIEQLNGGGLQAI